MIDIEKRPLGPFEQDVLTGLDRVPQQQRSVSHMRLEFLCVLEILVDDLVGLHRERVVDPGKNLVLLYQCGFDLLSEDLGIE